MTPSAPTLKERLLSEARTLLDADGIEAVGIREVARRAGVSHGAPRRHFASRELLLAALAMNGFAELEVDVREAVERAAEPRTRLLGAALAYVSYAVRNRALFDLMFRHDLLEGSGAGLRSRTLPLLATVGDLVARADDDLDAEVVAVDLWTAIHGIAVLSAHRSLDILTPRPDDRLLVEQQVARHLGLGQP